MIKVSRGCLGEKELEAVREAFEYGYFGHAYKVIEFEETLSKHFGRYVIATNTGTSALHLALDSLGIGSGDEVIVPSLTFVASFQAIIATGATPVACDVNPSTLSIDLNQAKTLISSRTKAIMPVHYAGSPCDMDSLLKLADEYALRVVEDAAHAFGSTYRGRKIGSFGDITCFSFDSIKNMTCGEGGALICSSSELAEIVRQKRLLGINRKEGIFEGKRWLYEVNTQGYRYHMSNINAAIGLVQFNRLPSFIQRRKDICRQYDNSFQILPGVSTLKIDYDDTAPHIYVIRVENGLRDQLMEHLKNRGIETSINYIPCHLQPFFKGKSDELSKTEEAYGEILSLPLHFELSDSDVSFVIEAIRQFY